MPVGIQDSSDNWLLVFSPAKQWKGLVFSSPDFASGSYTLYTGGSPSGTEVDGLYRNGSLKGGASTEQFNVSSTITSVGSSGGGMIFP